MKTLALASILVAFGGVVWLLGTQNQSEITGYRAWRKANETPHEMDSSLVWLCRTLTPEETARDARNPHLGPIARDRATRRFVTVYVNRIGEHAMLEEKNPSFHVGSVIVKEKLQISASTTPELLTVMIKHEKGYNPDCGNWEFMVCDGDGKRIQARGKLANCQSCHVNMKSSDFVSREYLSAELLKSLGIQTHKVGYLK